MNWRNIILVALIAAAIITITIIVTAAPTITSVTISTFSGKNMSTEDITATLNGVSETNATAYNWQLYNRSIAVLNLNFDVNNSAGTSKTRDYSSYNHTVNVGTNVAWNATGGINNTGGFTFPTGVGYASTYGLNVTLPTINNNFSVEFWMKPADCAARGILGTRTGTDQSFDLQTTAACKLHGDVGSGTAWINTALDSAGTFTAGVWTHVVYTITNTGYTIYINGQRDTSGTYTSSVPLFSDATHILQIGNINVGPNSAFYGDIDNFRVYNRSLTPQQVAALYQNRTDVIVLQELTSGQNWSVCVTPNNRTADGTTVCSTNMSIISGYSHAPGIDQVVINAPQGTPPFIVASTAVATNLSAEYLDNIPSDWFDKKNSCLPQKLEFTVGSTAYTEVYRCTNCSGTIGRLELYDVYSMSGAFMKLTVDGIDAIEFDNVDRVGAPAFTAYHPIGATYKNSLSIWGKVVAGGGTRGLATVCSYQPVKQNLRTCRPYTTSISTPGTTYQTVVQCTNCAGRISEIINDDQASGEQFMTNVTIDGRSTIINNQKTDTSYGATAYYGPLIFNNNMSIKFKGTLGSYGTGEYTYCLWENT